jgi:hypothetical protein
MGYSGDQASELYKPSVRKNQSAWATFSSV